MTSPTITSHLFVSTDRHEPVQNNNLTLLSDHINVTESGKLTVDCSLLFKPNVN